MKRRIGLPLALCCAAPSAHAHLMNTGFGPFYDGLTHLFVTPEDLLPVIALALLAGLRGPRFGRAVLFVLPAAWLVGAVAGISSYVSLTSPVVTTVVTITFGALVAADRPLRLWMVVGGAVLLGLLLGGWNGFELGRQSAIGLTVVGTGVALFVLVALLAGQVTTVRAAWARIAVRVGGSWITASGLLMLGWSIRGG